MATYLLTWNPKRWDWNNIDLAIDEISEVGYHIDSWSCGINKSIKAGDRVFLIRLGLEPRGIVASGIAHQARYQDVHWDEEKAKQGKYANYIDVSFDTILNPDKDRILGYDILSEGKLQDMHWSSQASGINIKDDIADELESVWSSFTENESISGGRAIELIPEEIVNHGRYPEGAVKQITVNKYERNAKARKACLSHYGYSCNCCGINLNELYGEIADGFIQVHHRVPLHTIGEEYELDPIKDLIPLCPNCHAVIHRFKPELSVEELRKIMKKKQKESTIRLFFYRYLTA